MTRLLYAVFLLLLASCLYAAAPVCSFIPGEKTGMNICTAKDGNYILTKTFRRKGVQLVKDDACSNLYLYFSVTDKDKIGPDCYAVIQYVSDEPLGGAAIEYNAGAKGDHFRGTGFVYGKAKGVSTAVCHMKGFRPIGTQHDGADFRIFINDWRLREYNHLMICRIDLYNQKPRVKETFVSPDVKGLPRVPEGFTYVYGNDVEDTFALTFKRLGVNTVQSFVAWETIEREKGNPDWTYWDNQVRIMKQFGFKWIPFLILGPAFSTPDWFRASSDHFPAICVEDNIPTKIESLWNPHIQPYIDHFLRMFAERYVKTGVINCVELGIQGDFGEAIYPVWGGGWTFNVPGEYHTHQAYWCNDTEAKKDFKRAMKAKYGTIDRLNRVWHTDFAGFDSITYPFGNQSEKDLVMKQLNRKGADRRRFYDFLDWYRGSMTAFADRWLKTARKYFPETDIYLCCGGHCEPELGGMFSQLAKKAAQYGAGLRVTNEMSDYTFNVSGTHFLASACRLYGIPYGFEPGDKEDVEDGILCRMYNAAAEGASQLHDFNFNIITSPEAMAKQQECLPVLSNSGRKPIKPVALWYPERTISLDWGTFHSETIPWVRDRFDTDITDSVMLRDGALKRNSVLIIPYGNIIEAGDAVQIAEWAKRGGTVITMVPRFEGTDGMDTPERILFSKGSRGGALGRGAVIRVNDEEELSQAVRAALAAKEKPVYDFSADNIFVTQTGERRFLIYNRNPKAMELDITIGSRSFTAQLPPKSVTDYYCK